MIKTPKKSQSTKRARSTKKRVQARAVVIDGALRTPSKASKSPKIYFFTTKDSSRPARSGIHIVKKANASQIRKSLKISHKNISEAYKVVESTTGAKAIKKKK